MRPEPKRLPLAASLKYGWRLTFKYFKTLVPSVVVFYVPDLAEKAGLVPGPWVSGAWHSIVACLLIRYAMQISDRETRDSRVQAPGGGLDAPGYLRRSLTCAAIFWGGLAVGLWPSLCLATGSWWPVGHLEALPWLGAPRHWSMDQAWLAVGVVLMALPAGLWTVYGWFHGYYVADEGLEPCPAIVRSYYAVQGAFFKAVFFLLVIGAINAAGYAAYVVGVFLAFPVTLMATTYVHLELKDQTWPKAPAKRRKR